MFWHWRKQREHDLERELRSHLDQETEEQREFGLSSEEARYAARRALGNPTLVKENAREIWGWGLLERTWQDLRYALRQLRRTPVFTFTAVMTLALGIGANTAIFSLLNGLLLRSLPVRSPGDLVLFEPGSSEGRFVGTIPDPGPLPLYSYPLYERLRDRSHFFDGIAAQQSGDTEASVRWSGSAAEGTTDQAFARPVTANYFDVLGVTAFRGRTFGVSDQTAPGANPVLVLSYGYWKRRFGSDPAVIGSRLTVNGTPYTVIGIAAPGFTGTKIGSGTDFWVPITMQPQLTLDSSLLSDRGSWWLLVIGRLKSGASLKQAQAEENVILQQFLRETPATVDEATDQRLARVALRPGAKGVSTLRRRFGLSLLVLLSGVALLLLVACSNISHLLLARSIRRQREVSLRLALGASHARLFRQFLTEGLLLSGAGAALGLVIARWSSAGLLLFVAGGADVVGVDIRPDARVLGFAALVTIATAVLFSFAPWWSVSRSGLNAMLQASVRNVGGSRWTHALSRTFLISQVALSLVLLIGAGLLVRTLHNLRDIDKGFREEHVLIAELNPRLTGLNRQQVMPIYDRVLERVSSLPGVKSASFSLNTPLGGAQSTLTISVPGHTSKSSQQAIAEILVVTPRYFDTLGMTLAQGRRFDRRDQAKSLKVAMVNETMARRYFTDGEALGKRFVAGSQDSSQQYVVVGIVRDAKLDGLREEPLPVYFLPVMQSPEFLHSLQVRTFGDPIALVRQIRQIILNANAGLPITKLTTLHDQVDRSLIQQRLVAMLSSAVGASALLLVCLGLYGALSQAVAQRTAEIGVRIALGAARQQVQWLMLREALGLVLLGAAIGVPAALGLTHWMGSLLFGLSPTDPLTFTGACLAVVFVTALASYLPAWRASRVDPIVALRYE